MKSGPLANAIHALYRPRMLSRLFIILIAAQTGLTAALPPEKNDRIGNPPWHLVDYWWDFGKDTEFQSYEVDFTLSNDVDPKVRLYIAPIGLGYLNKVPFYGGIQTLSDGYRTHPHPRRREYIGKGAIFSRWNERDIKATRKSEGGLFESGGYEGDFISVRNKCNWTKGRYTYRIKRGKTETINGKEHTWVEASVFSHADKKTVSIGALRFPGAKLMLGRQLAGFIEIYGPRIPLEKIPKITVTFEAWRINGKATPPKSALAYYPRNVPQYAGSKVEGKQVIGTIGKNVDRNQSKGTSKQGRSWVQRLY